MSIRTYSDLLYLNISTFYSNIWTDPSKQAKSNRRWPHGQLAVMQTAYRAVTADQTMLNTNIKYYCGFKHICIYSKLCIFTVHSKKNNCGIQICSVIFLVRMIIHMAQTDTKIFLHLLVIIVKICTCTWMYTTNVNLLEDL